MGKLTLAFAMAAGLAAGADAQTADVTSPAAVAAAQRPNFRRKAPAADANAEANTAEANSRFVSSSAAAADAPKPGEGAPFWQAIEQPGEPMDYFRYWGLNGATTAEQAALPGFNNEIRSSTTDPHRPQPLDNQPVVFNFQQSAPIAMETQFAGCPFRNQPDNKIFWFNPYANADKSHTDLGADPDNHPNYRYGVPGEWTISQPMNGVRGLSVTSAAEGNAPGAPDGGYAVAVTYVTDRRCSDGNNEYGFWKELASSDPKAQEKDQQSYFYYSIKTNCSSQFGCRASDSWDGAGQDQVTSPLTVFTHIQSAESGRRLPLEESSPVAASTETATASAETADIARRPIRPPERLGQQFNYAAYFVPDDQTDADHGTGYKFRVQVTEADNPSKFAKCSINGGPLQDCQTDVRILNWFPAAQIQTSAVQVVTGTQTSGVNAPAPLTPGAKLTVQSLNVGK